jgi:hypothetical protein
MVDKQSERAHNKRLRFGHELSHGRGGTETAEGTARHCPFLALAEHPGSQAIWSGHGVLTSYQLSAILLWFNRLPSLVCLSPRRRRASVW